MTEESCREVRANLSELLEGDLAPDAGARVVDHLRGCEACRAELEALKQTLEALRALPREEPPADLLRRIESRLGGAPRPLPARRVGRFRFRRHAVAMLLVIGILVGIIRVLPHGPAPLHAPRPPAPAARLEADRGRDLSREQEKSARADRLAKNAPGTRSKADLKDADRQAAVGASRDERAMIASAPAASAPAEPAAPAPAVRAAKEKKAEAFATGEAGLAASANQAAPSPAPFDLFQSPRPDAAWSNSVREALLRRPAEAAAAWSHLTDAQRAAALDAWARAPHPRDQRQALDSAASRANDAGVASMLRTFLARTP